MSFKRIIFCSIAKMSLVTLALVAWCAMCVWMALQFRADGPETYWYLLLLVVMLFTLYPAWRLCEAADRKILKRAMLQLRMLQVKQDD